MNAWPYRDPGWQGPTQLLAHPCPNIDVTIRFMDVVWREQHWTPNRMDWVGICRGQILRVGDEDDGDVLADSVR